MLEDGLANIRLKYLNIENSVCFMDLTVFVFELTLPEHKHPEVLEGKDREVKILKGYKDFKEVVDDGQDTIVSQWVITQKDKQDGQKIEHKVRLVARGF